MFPLMSSASKREELHSESYLCVQELKERMRTTFKLHPRWQLTNTISTRHGVPI